MFEISNRHAPVFALSDVGTLAALLEETLDLKTLTDECADLEFAPLAQTARINEISGFTVRSALGPAEVKRRMAAATALRLWRDGEGFAAADRLFTALQDRLSPDSAFAIGTAVSPELARLAGRLPAPSASSRKTVILLQGGLADLQNRISSDLLDRDHLVIWVGAFDPEVMADQTEAFFALAPQFRLETELNRYEAVETLAPVFVGMARF